jgi:hypothetical protein
VAGPQLIVDNNAAIDRHTGVLRQRDIGTNACREHHSICRNNPAIDQLNGLNIVQTKDLPGIGAENDLDALAFHQPLEQRTCGRIELALHQAIHQMQKRYFRTCLGETICGLKAKQSAADDHDTLLSRASFSNMSTSRLSRRYERPADPPRAR